MNTLALLLLVAAQDAEPQTAAVPPGRSGHTFAYDPAAKRIVMHGGQDSDTKFADTWIWNASGWAQLETEGPGDRLNASMAWDGQRMVLFGGSSAKKRMGDTWGLEGDKWVLYSAGDGPEPRTLADMAYDEKRKKLVLFGGKTKDKLEDTWEWDATEKDWARVGIHGPSPRGAHEMAFDAGRETILCYAGYGEGTVSDLWEWDGTAWGKLADPTAPGRLHFAMDYDTANKNIVVFGGFGAEDRGGDTWTWDGKTWKEHTSPGPLARAEHDGAYFPGVGFLIFGGVVGQDMSFSKRDQASDLWIWDGRSWSNWKPERAVKPK